MDSQEFAGRVALITGGGSGIGAAVGRRLYDGGATVILADFDQAKARDIGEAMGNDDRVHAISLDVREPDQARGAVEFAVKNFGALHLAVNNAGIIGPNPVNLCDMDDASFRAVWETNVTGVFNGLKHQIPEIIRSGGGAIVNLSSMLGIIAIAGMGPYIASKHAVVGLTRAAAVEYSGQGVRINAVGAGYIRTPMINNFPEHALRAAATKHPIGRLGTAEEVAELISFLLSDRASFVTGSMHIVDGGYTAL